MTDKEVRDVQMLKRKGKKVSYKNALKEIVNGTVLSVKTSFGETSYYIKADAWPHSTNWYHVSETNEPIKENL